MYRYYLQNTDMYVAPATLTRIVNIYYHSVLLHHLQLLRS